MRYAFAQIRMKVCFKDVYLGILEDAF